MCGDNPTVRWTGHADGRYEVRRPDEPRVEPGTTVTVYPRPGAAEWLAGPLVTELARLYGSLLPVRVMVGSTEVTEGGPPWRRPVACRVSSDSRCNCASRRRGASR